VERGPTFRLPSRATRLEASRRKNSKAPFEDLFLVDTASTFKKKTLSFVSHTIHHAPFREGGWFRRTRFLLPFLPRGFLHFWAPFFFALSEFSLIGSGFRRLGTGLARLSPAAID